MAYTPQTSSSLLQPRCSAAAYSGFTQHLRTFQEFPKTGRRWVCLVKDMKDNRRLEFCGPKTVPGRWIGDRLVSLQSCALECGLVEMAWAVSRRLKHRGATLETHWEERMNGACSELSHKGLRWRNREWESMEHSTCPPCLPVWLFLPPLYFLQHLPSLLAHLHWSLFPPMGCSIVSVATAPLLPACGSRRLGGGGIAQRMPGLPGLEIP